MDKNQGYEIIKAVMLENGRGFALGHNPAASTRSAIARSTTLRLRSS